MAKYRPIYTKIWKDPDFQDYSPIAKIIFIYLCTNESTTDSGIYPLSIKTIANETGVDIKQVNDLMLNGNIKNISYDFDNQYVFVRRFKSYNQGGNPDLVIKGIVNDFKQNSKTSLWQEFLKEYPEFESDILSNTNPKPKLMYPYQTVEQPLANGSSKTHSDDFQKYIDMLKTTRYPQLNVTELWEDCQSWYKDHGKVMSDAKRALNNWCKKELDIHPPRKGKDELPTTAELKEEWGQ